jgi:hypothetical protein
MKKIILLSVFWGCFYFSLLADSPLTSTDIYLGYKNEPIVAEALEFKVLSKNILEYLASPENPIAVKIAAINALGWNIEGTTYAETFYKYLQDKNDYESIYDLVEGSDSELTICLAYFKALGDYFEVDDAIWNAKHAIQRSNSYTVHIICALIEAQKAMDEDLCEVYELVNRVRENKTLTDDMNEEAKAEIFAYMDMYDCSQGGE